MHRVALFAAMLASAGIPLYIHLPRFAATELGLGLGALGAILLGIRVMDFVQDPLLGRLVDRFPAGRRGFAALAVAGLAVGFALLFAVPAPVAPGLWLVATLVLIFTAYSLATILFYSQGVAIAAQAGDGAHYRLAGWRESGTLAGVVLAAVLPALLLAAGREATLFRDYGMALAGFALLAWALSRPIWTERPLPAPRADLSVLLTPEVRGLLLLALINALPAAVTSTLFVFFVEDYLALAGMSGPLLLGFFAAAGISAPLWSRAARRYPPRRVLLAGMVLAIAGFSGAGLLAPGDALGFAVICVVTGIATGADMVILPALFSATLARGDHATGSGFGLWSFAAKMSLALAAALVLPLLALRGFVPAGSNTPQALDTLRFAYAVVPCALKLLAVALVWRLPQDDTATAPDALTPSRV